MKAIYEISFDDKRGIECERCMLSISKGEKNICSALGNRPVCPEDGCRKDCPLKLVE